MRSSFLTRGLPIVVIIVQILDILVHAASDQLEPVRVASNALVIVWAVAVLSGRVTAWVRLTIGLIGGYIALNAIFLMGEGLTNPATGQPRTALFLLVGATVILSAVWTANRRR